MNILCSIHNKEMRLGKYGYFCPTLITTTPAGKNIWCDFKVKDVGKTVLETSTISPQPEQPEELDNWMPKQTSTPTKQPDWDKIAEGKIRSLFVEAIIQHKGLKYLTPEDVDILNQLVHYAMSGKIAELDENLSDEEIEEIKEVVTNEV